MHRQSHLHGVPTSENIAEIAGRNSNINSLAIVNFLLSYQLAIAIEIIDNLRQQSAPVDGISGRKILPLGSHLGGQILIAKD